MIMQESGLPGERPPDDPLVLDGHDFVELLGSTPLTVTSLYLERSSHARVVVKEIRPEVCRLPGFEERFQERLAQVAAVEHPHILRLVGHGRTEDGAYYVIREYVDGFPLRVWMQTSGIDHSSVINVVFTLAGAIEVWHQKGCAHGSVRASNVWIGHDHAVKLEVFPVSSLLEPAQLVHLLGLEVVNAMPPEFTTGGAASVRSDIHALAALYYELLTGGAARDVLGRIATAREVDIRIRPVLAKALSPCPTQRQASMAEFCKPLLNIVAAGSLPLAPAATGRPEIKSYASMTIPLVAILCLLWVAAGVGWYVWRQADERAEAARAQMASSGARPRSEDGAKGKTEAGVIGPERPAATGSPRVNGHGGDGSAEDTGMPSDLDNPEEIREETIVSHPVPGAPPPSPGAGDAYIYAAHFYLGSDVSLLKLEFGNAGKGILYGDSLAFQCAFSTDERLEDLVPANSGAMPSPGQDLAAGGFTTKWLGHDRVYLMAGKKLWTKHTFRIDSSDPEVLARAKFLLVKISPHHSVVEADYLNNVIAIPLDHPDQWHSVTQDPADAAPADDGNPAPAPLPEDPVEP